MATHVTPRLTAAQAVAALGQSCSWPDLFAPGGVEAELWWVPVDPASGRVRTEVEGLATLPGVPPDSQGEPVPGKALAEQGPFYPVWSLRREEDHVLVDGVRGACLAGAWRPEAGAARRWLWFTVFMAIYGCLISAYLVAKFAALTWPAFWNSIGQLTFWVLLGAGLPAVVWCGRRLKALLAGALEEPLAVAESGRVRFPCGQTWRWLLRLNGVAAVVLWIDIVGGQVQATLMGLPLPGAFYFLFFLASVSFLAAFWWRSLVLGRGVSPPAGELTGGGTTHTIVDVAVHITVVTAVVGIGAVVFQGAFLPGFPNWKPFWAYGALAGSTLGLLTAPMPRDARGILILATLVSKAGEAYLGAWFATVFSLGAVFLPVWLQRRGEEAEAVSHALRSAWAFAFGQTAGRLVGRWLGFFFLGFEGGPLGVVLGERLGGMAAFLKAEES